MGYLCYCWLVVRQAWSELLDRAQAILFVLTIVAGGAVAMSPNLSHAVDTILSWRGAAVVLGAVVVARLAVAPYRLWKAEAEKVAALEARLAPKIRLSFDPHGVGIQRTPKQTTTKIVIPPTPPIGANVPGNPGGEFNVVNEHMAAYVRI